MSKVKDYYIDEIEESNERLKRMEEYRYWSQIENEKVHNSIVDDYNDYYKIPNPKPKNESN
jgi:hypothetical protein